MLRQFGWPDARCYYKPPNILVCRELMEVANSNGSSYSDGVGRVSTSISISNLIVRHLGKLIIINCEFRLTLDSREINFN